VGAFGQSSNIWPTVNVRTFADRGFAAKKSPSRPPHKILRFMYPVISAGAPSKAVSADELLKWMDEHSTKLYPS
jgi:hypothetical protein